MYYVKMFYDALSSEDYIEKVNEILLGVTFFESDEKVEIVDYVYKSFCDAAMFFDENVEKEEYCSTVKLSLYKLREKEIKKRKRKAMKEKSNDSVDGTVKKIKKVKKTENNSRALQSVAMARMISIDDLKKRKR